MSPSISNAPESSISSVQGDSTGWPRLPRIGPGWLDSDEETQSTSSSQIDDDLLRVWLLEDLETVLYSLQDLYAKLEEYGREEVDRAMELIQTTVSVMRARHQQVVPRSE